MRQGTSRRSRGLPGLLLLVGLGRVFGSDLPEAALGLRIQNEISHVQGVDRAPSRWLLVGAPALRVRTQDGAAAPAMAESLPPGDSLRYVGLQVEAARGFQADIRVFDNLGQFVNRFTFSVPASEFKKLPLSPDGRTRRLTVLWDNRSEDGHLVGTGSYVLKSRVSLEHLPGVPDTDGSRTQYRRFGVIRKY